MSESKHTPGPWEGIEGTPIITKQWNGRSISLANVQRPAWHEDHNKASEEAGANAARIVACVNGCDGINPEAVKYLLAACKKMVEYRDRAGPMGFQLEKADDFFAMARKAISKATGEEVPA